MSDLVSVIIPTYNTGRFIGDAVNSVLAQTYPNIEIIVIDDGSTDNTAEILAQFGGKINVISKQNGGTASALNAGIQMASGEWIKWLSADDVLLPNAVQILIDAATSHPNGKNCIFYTPYLYINELGEVINEFKEPENNHLSQTEQNNLLLDHFIGNGSSGIMHKSIFTRFGMFNEKIRPCEDYEMWLWLCLFHGIKLWRLPDILLKYRIHENQITRQYGARAWDVIHKYRNYYRDCYENSKTPIRI